MEIGITGQMEVQVRVGLGKGYGGSELCLEQHSEWVRVGQSYTHQKQRKRLCSNGDEMMTAWKSILIVCISCLLNLMQRTQENIQNGKSCYLSTVFMFILTAILDSSFLYTDITVGGNCNTT